MPALAGWPSLSHVGKSRLFGDLLPCNHKLAACTDYIDPGGGYTLRVAVCSCLCRALAVGLCWPLLVGWHRAGCLGAVSWYPAAAEELD
eukprot:2284399-Lingulodinium_polyedra.AAC.1